MNKISAIVPVAPWDLNRSQLLFKSLKKFFDPGSLETLYITFPDRQKMKDILALLKLDFPVEVMTEEDLIPASDYSIFKKRKGWLRQQIVKMYISSRVKTEFYICLDADVLCFRQATYADLIKDDRPGMNLEPKTWHKYWWDASLKVLKMPDPGTSYGMSSSTNIFITAEVLSLMEYLEKIYGKSFIRTLLNWFWTNTYKFGREWTEYKLYWLYIELHQKSGLYDPRNKILGNSIWKSTKVVDEALFREIFDPLQEGYFTVCQSTRVKDDVIAHFSRQELGI